MRHSRSPGENQRPSLILARTHIGYGSPHKQDNFTAHGDPLGEEELTSDEEGPRVADHGEVLTCPPNLWNISVLASCGAQMEDEWLKKFDAYKQAFPKEAAEFESIIADKLPQDWD